MRQCGLRPAFDTFKVSRRRNAVDDESSPPLECEENDEDSFIPSFSASRAVQKAIGRIPDASLVARFLEEDVEQSESGQLTFALFVELCDRCRNQDDPQEQVRDAVGKLLHERPSMTVAELRAKLSRSGETSDDRLALSTAELDFIFAKLDPEHTGTISHDTLTAVLTKPPQAVLDDDLLISPEGSSSDADLLLEEDPMKPLPNMEARQGRDSSECHSGTLSELSVHHAHRDSLPSQGMDTPTVNGPLANTSVVSPPLPAAQPLPSAPLPPLPRSPQNVIPAHSPPPVMEAPQPQRLEPQPEPKPEAKTSCCTIM
jgi:Ca2+-binding EF-hand superfamily protein